jgi:hypothetical protein
MAYPPSPPTWKIILVFAAVACLLYTVWGPY